MPMPGLDFERLRTEVPMREVLNLLGFVATNGRGDQLYGPCPLRPPKSERSRRRERYFSVNLKAGRFYCRDCGELGNQLELWAAATKQPIYEAALDLCSR